MVSPAVIDTTDATFAQDVIDRSSELPVIVDFWAPWCGPCRILSPILETLAYEFQGTVQVAKLDTDENPQTAGQFGISGIPAVIAFSDGKPVNQFVGALPEPQVREFFEGLRPSEVDLKVHEAATLVENGQTGAAQLHLESALQEQPDHQEASLALASILAQSGDAKRARELVTPWESVPAAQRILSLLTLQESAQGYDQSDLETRLSADETDAQAHYELGCLLAANGDWEPALEHLLQTVRLDRSIDDDGARLRLIDAFNLLGPENPLTRTYRRKLGQVLF
jgi:putative thioredoxin